MDIIRIQDEETERVYGLCDGMQGAVDRWLRAATIDGFTWKRLGFFCFMYSDEREYKWT